MTRFIQVDMPTEHPGLVRVTRGAENLVANVRAFDGTRGTATLLLAALVSALVVVANELVVTWTEGHLLAAWIADHAADHFRLVPSQITAPTTTSAPTTCTGASQAGNAPA